MSVHIRHENKINILHIIFTLFLFALVFSSFHYHKNLRINEKSCLLCLFLALITAVAISWFTFLTFIFSRHAIFYKIDWKLLKAFGFFGVSRAPPYR